MKVVIYSVSSLLKPHFGVLLDEAESLSRDGNPVTFIYCDKFLSYCSYNPAGSKLICQYCQHEYKKLFRQANENIKFVPLSYYGSFNHLGKFSYNDASDIKKIVYKDVEIGYSCLSQYITDTRNSSPVVSEAFISYFDRLLLSAKNIVDVAEKVIQREMPDAIKLFNGRTFDNNAFWCLAYSLNIYFECLEVRGNHEFYRRYFKNFPHSSIENRTKNIIEAWDNSPMEFECKCKLGRSFFIKKQKGIRTNDKVYTVHQVNQRLPEGFDSGKHNIAIFNSSEDELVSLGSSFERNNLFRNQLEGIEYVLSQFKLDTSYHFYLRIHPNLRGISYSYHTDLYRMSEQYSNVTIIPPESPIDSYALMNACEKIIVFSSTMGIEAVYWRKVVLVLSASYYFHLRGFYKPSNKKEVITMLKKDLIPLDNSDALKYGFYQMYYDSDMRYRFVNFDKCYTRIFTKKIVTSNYQKLLGSRSLFAVANAIILFIDRNILGLFRCSIPK